MLVELTFFLLYGLYKPYACFILYDNSMAIVMLIIFWWLCNHTRSWLIVILKYLLVLCLFVCLYLLRFVSYTLTNNQCKFCTFFSYFEDIFIDSCPCICVIWWCYCCQSFPFNDSRWVILCFCIFFSFSFSFFFVRMCLSVPIEYIKYERAKLLFGKFRP